MTTNDQPDSPPFRDSDAMQIIIKRMELVADMMRRRKYGNELQVQMAEIADWLEWLAKSIASRTEGGE